MNRRGTAPFDEFFQEATGFLPYTWLFLIAEDGLPETLSIPTGLGKTEVALPGARRLLIATRQGPLRPGLKIRDERRIKRSELDKYIAAQPRGAGGGRDGE